MKNYLNRILLVIICCLLFILGSNFIAAYRGVLFDMFGNMREPYDLICGIIFVILGLAFGLLYAFLPLVKYPGVKIDVRYNEDCKIKLREKFELIDKVEKDYKKEMYTSSSLSINENLIFIESKNISGDVFRLINDETDLFSGKVKKLNNKNHILYILCLVENITQEDENAIVSKVVGYRRGAANSLVMPVIINISEKYLEVCPLEYKQLQDYFLYNQMEHKFVKYLDRVGLISLVEENGNGE